MSKFVVGCVLLGLFQAAVYLNAWVFPGQGIGVAIGLLAYLALWGGLTLLLQASHADGVADATRKHAAVLERECHAARDEGYDAGWDAATKGERERALRLGAAAIQSERFAGCHERGETECPAYQVDIVGAVTLRVRSSTPFVRFQLRGADGFTVGNHYFLLECVHVVDKATLGKVNGLPIDTSSVELYETPTGTTRKRNVN